MAKNQGSVRKPKVTFDMLFDKYSKQKDVTSDQPLKKKDEITFMPRRAIFEFKGFCKIQR